MGDIKLDGETRNLESDNVRALAEAFPEVVADGKVDFDKLKLILGDDVDDSDERYSFTWPGKRDAIKMAISRTTGTLRPDKKNSKDWDTTSNLFIEGDNLEVLRVLQNSYRGKVKMIYIDPPYNTGKDFIYKDDFKDNLRNYKENASLEGQSNPETAGRYHTNWLNMMYPRLRLAKNLLKDDGVIFISIDDNEIHNLKKLCDEIFGESNFVSQITVHSNPRGSQSSKYMAEVHEYVLMYRRSSRFVIKSLPLSQETIADYKYVEGNRRYRLLGLRQRGGAWRREQRPKMYYPIFVNPEDGSVSLEKNDKYSIEVLPRRPSGEDSRWGWGREKFAADSKTLIGKKVNEGLAEEKYDIFRKDYLEDENGEIKGARPKTFWGDKKFNYQNGRVEIDALFSNSETFDFPKPTSIVKDPITFTTEKDDIILDFFAGSATTAHAVMDLNAEDGGSRKFVMVQIPESTPEGSEARKAGYKTIAEISRKRIELAGEKIKADHKDKLVERTSPLDVGFKAFTLDTTNFREWDSNTDNIQNELLAALETFKEGRNSEDALYEVLLKYGVDITEPVEVLSLGGKQVYSLAGNYLLVCLEKDIPLGTIEAMTALKPERVVCYDDGFADEDVKQNALETLKRAGVADVRVV